jgi:adenylate cyclase
VVPESVVFRNGARKIDATYLYADLAGSSEAAQKLRKVVTAKIIRSFLNAAYRVIRAKGGEVRSYDGDRVMAIFIGDGKDDRAVDAALGINWAMHEVIRPKLTSTWPDLDKHYTPRHAVGIDSGEALIVAGGIRSDSDLVSIGAPPNVAAKLSDIRTSGTTTFITKRVLDALSERNRVGGRPPREMWKRFNDQTVGGRRVLTYSSTFYRRP